MWMLPVARALQHGRVSKLLRHVAICRRGNILKTFLMKMGESSYMTKALICRRIIKKTMLSWKSSEGAREKGEEGDRRSGLFLRSSIMSLSQAHYNWAKKQIKLKSLRIDGNPRKRKRVVICKQLFPASSLPVRRWASENFPTKIKACVLWRKGQLYEVFLVLAKTPLI